MAPTVFLSNRILTGNRRVDVRNLYFFPMDVPHFGHVKVEKRNPGFGGTGVPHLGQCPSPGPEDFAFFIPDPDTDPGEPKVLPILIGFCAFRCGIHGPL